MTTTAERKAASLQWLDDIWNRKRPAAIFETLGADSVGHTDQGDVLGPEPFAEFQAHFLGGVPDLRFIIEDSIAEGDHVVIRWIAEGTHIGPLMGVPASGRPIRVFGMSWLRYQDGRIVEGWDSWSRGSLMQQIAGEAPAGPGPA
jgi:steroid delta-isomerase-like uncharacterized protein